MDQTYKSIYTIGVACLLPDLLSNKIRHLELELATRTNNFDGLCQPPNVTLKRPFVVHSLEELNDFIEEFEKLKSRHAPLDISFEGIKKFSETSLYIGVKETEQLLDIHRDLLDISSRFTLNDDLFEGKNVIFHCSLMLNTDKQQLDSARKIYEEHSELTKDTFKSGRLSILLKTESDDWNEYHTVTLID